MKNLKKVGKILDKAEQRAISGGRPGSYPDCTSNCDCYHWFPSNESYGYVCYKPTFAPGQCVQGIYYEPPCG